MKPHIIKLPLY